MPDILEDGEADEDDYNEWFVAYYDDDLSDGELVS